MKNLDHLYAAINLATAAETIRTSHCPNIEGYVFCAHVPHDTEDLTFSCWDEKHTAKEAARFTIHKGGLITLLHTGEYDKTTHLKMRTLLNEYLSRNYIVEWLDQRRNLTVHDAIAKVMVQFDVSYREAKQELHNWTKRND